MLTEKLWFSVCGDVGKYFWNKIKQNITLWALMI